MMKRLWILFVCLLLSFQALAQDPNGNYNPYVNQGIIEPSPLWPLENGGTGIASFKIGNTGSDPLQVFTDQRLLLTITLSYGEPDHADPLQAISGSAASLFTWEYSDGTYTGIQQITMQAESVGQINIAYKVNQNSLSPGSNGFNVNITPAPYHTASNSQNDDAVSSYTYTEIRDYGDAPLSYGSVWHTMDQENYLGATADGEFDYLASTTALGDDNQGVDDEDGVQFPGELKQGQTVNIPVEVTGLGRLNVWIDWNGDGDFDDNGEHLASNILRSEGIQDLEVDIPQTAVASVPTYARFRFSAGNITSPSGAASGGEVEDYLIEIVSSEQAPTIPAGLSVSTQTETEVSLTWEASVDEDGIREYRIFRNGSLLGTSQTLSYTDLSVQVGQIFTYAVSAMDNEGFESGRSLGIEVEIYDVTPPTVPTNLVSTDLSHNSVALSWTPSVDNLEVAEYHVYRDNVHIHSSSAWSYRDTGLEPEREYSYAIKAIDAAGNESAFSDPLLLKTLGTSGLDLEPPSVPRAFSLEMLPESCVGLKWEPATDNVGVAGYQIYRMGNYYASVEGTKFQDTAVVPGEFYPYTVSAIDLSGNEGDKTMILGVIVKDNTPPTAPSGLDLVERNEKDILVVWKASVDNVGLAGYFIYRNGHILDTVDYESFRDSTLVADSSNIYQVVAFDEEGNRSEFSSPLGVYPLSVLKRSNDLTFRLYPNPARNYVEVDWGSNREPGVLNLISPAGTLLFQKEFDTNETHFRIETALFSPGMYLIQLRTRHASYWQTLIILD